MNKSVPLAQLFEAWRGLAADSQVAKLKRECDDLWERLRHLQPEHDRRGRAVQVEHIRFTLG